MEILKDDAKTIQDKVIPEVDASMKLAGVNGDPSVKKLMRAK
jgi:hypothetical protein